MSDRERVIKQRYQIKAFDKNEYSLYRDFI
jgi:hypothetical protein